MRNTHKYVPYERMRLKDRKWPDNVIEKAPIWCSVDLRDGNQALPIPMNVDQKLELFQLLCNIGFKEIEAGFPSASQIEFDFNRRLIEEGRIPDGVSLQVLTQAREHLIRKTFESIKGAKKAVLHIYNSTSTLQRRVTFGMSKDEIKKIAIDGVETVKSLLPEVAGTEITLEYSPESFTGTEMDYAMEVCEAVIDTWEPEKNGKVILNLPATVEMSTPNIYADQIEWFHRNIKDRNNVILSLHTHNDRGTGVAATELALMAGADRVEGTLFGNGERTGNLDIVTVALNMFSQGVDPQLDFSNINDVRKIYEKTTGMTVHDRHPYSGDLVFTAFSGSHQDAIKKGMDKLGNKEKDLWAVPYLPIDPEDLGRSYEAIIRINSQSGKGGVSYIMQREFGLELPKTMHPEVGRKVNEVSDKLVKELSSDEVYKVFAENFLNISKPLDIVKYALSTNSEGDVELHATIEYEGVREELEGHGNGPIDAFVHAMRDHKWDHFKLMDYHEQSIGSGSSTEAVAYILLKTDDGREVWGAGLHTDTIAASLHALCSAFNRTRL